MIKVHKTILQAATTMETGLVVRTIPDSLMTLTSPLLCPGLSCSPDQGREGR